MKLKSCPTCGNTSLGERWANGRKLTQFCNGYDDYQGDTCSWVGEPYTPPKRRITTTKNLQVMDFSGWDFTVYDKYGHVMTLSRTYGTNTAAMKELEHELEQGERDVNAGPYTGVLFKTPVRVVLQGTMFRCKKGVVQAVKK
jgi:hypothetical protein